MILLYRWYEVEASEACDRCKFSVATVIDSVGWMVDTSPRDAVVVVPFAHESI